MREMKLILSKEDLKPENRQIPPASPTFDQFTLPVQRALLVSRVAEYENGGGVSTILIVPDDVIQRFAVDDRVEWSGKYPQEDLKRSYGEGPFQVVGVCLEPGLVSHPEIVTVLVGGKPTSFCGGHFKIKT